MQDLAERQIQDSEDMELTVSTFAKWSREFFPNIAILKDEERQNKIKELSFNVPLPPDFVIDEVDYLLGRFLSNLFIDYVGCKRVRRGLSPRIDRNLRQELLEKVVYPYELWKSQINRFDWNDLAVWLSKYNAKRRYEIIVADEAQDFSANQARAIMNFAADPSSIVFVLDAAQRIYPRGFAWAEAGVPIRQSCRLKENHRNTKEICQFAAPLLDGLDISDDGTFPDLH